MLANSAAEMAGAILNLVNHPSKREEIARRARKHVEEHYDYKKIATELDMFYRQLMTKSHSTSTSAGLG